MVADSMGRPAAEAALPAYKANKASPYRGYLPWIGKQIPQWLYLLLSQTTSEGQYSGMFTSYTYRQPLQILQLCISSGCEPI